MFANSIFGALSWFSPIILGFVSTPILVKGLGTEDYGLYAIILGFLSYSFTFGIGRAASKYTAEYSASNEPVKLSQSLSAVLLFSAAIGIVGAATLAALTPWVVSSIMLLPESQRSSAETGLYIACATGLMAMISQVFQSTIQGTHRFGTYLLLSNLGAILLSSGNIALALAGYRLPALLVWNLFAVLTTGILFFFAAVRSVPDFRPTIYFGGEIFRVVAKYTLSIILYQVFANVFYIFERTWVVRRFGSTSLTFYAVPMLLGLYLHGLVGSFAIVLFPRLNELLTNRERLLELYLKANRLVVGIIMLISVSLVVSGKEFLILWVGPEFGERSYAVLCLHTITFSLIASNIIVWNIAEAFRATGLNVAITFTWLVVGVSLMVLIGDTHGIEGIAAARLAVTLLTTPIIFYAEKRFLGGIQFRYWLTLLARVSFAAVLLAAAQASIANLLPVGWTQFVVSAAAGTAVYGIVLLLTGFFEKNEIDRIRAIFFRPRKYN